MFIFFLWLMATIHKQKSDKILQLLVLSPTAQNTKLKFLLVALKYGGVA